MADAIIPQDYNVRERILASNSLLPLLVRQVVDPKINVQHMRYYDVLKSASENLQIILPCSGVSDSSLQFTNPFTPTNILDRRMTITAGFAYTATVAAPFASKILNIGQWDCPRQSPIQQVITQISSQLNTTTFNLPTNDVLSAILTDRIFHTDRDKMMSTTPMWPDQFQEYSAGVLTNRSPMALYGDNVFETPRGGWPQITIPTNTTTAAAWNAIYTDMILLPPYFQGASEGPGFVGVTTNSWNLNMSSDLTRTWSHCDNNAGLVSPPPVWNSFTASMVSSGFIPKLNYNILVPMSIPPLPSDVYYPLTVLDRMTTQAGIIPAWTGPPAAINSALISVQSNMVNLSFVPQKVLIYLRESNLGLTYMNGGYTKSDVFAGIQSVNITFNSRSGLLNNASQYQLYQFSVESGLDMSFPQWFFHRGSPLLLGFGNHIPLINPDLSPGVRGNYNFQATVTFYNPNRYRAINYTLYVIPYYEGTLVTKPGVSVQQQGVISHENVIEASGTPPLPASNQHELMGNGPFDFIRNIISKVSPFISKALPIAKALAPVVGPLLGFGLNQGASSVAQISQDSREIRNEIEKGRRENSALVGRLVAK